MNSENSGANSAGTATVVADSNRARVSDALRQLQVAVSNFVQESQANMENIISLMNQLNQRSQQTDVKIQQNTSQIERLSSWIENYRQ